MKLLNKIDYIYYHIGCVLWHVATEIFGFVFAVCRGLANYCYDRRSKYMILKIKEK